ncbi:MAG: glutathione S-transferase family protein [Pikeienuella sp.]
MSTQAEIILHNYPQSPVAEKVRVALGIKGMAWRSVEIPRIPPKPMLIPLTGGYRRTPVMQIGADIYCDSARILDELDRRQPEPPMNPRDGGMVWGLSRWADGALFSLGVKLVLGAAGDALPTDFAEDRGRLYLGPNWAELLAGANTELPHLTAQARAAFAALNSQLADGRAFLTGDRPGAVDAQVFHVVWFVRGRWVAGPAFLSEFPELERWEAAVAALGHGQMAEMTAEEALAVARDAAPASAQGVAAHEPQGLSVGDRVSVSPDVDGGEQPVEGEVWAADAQNISVLRRTTDCGDLCVHFPRAGYRITAI